MSNSTEMYLPLLIVTIGSAESNIELAIHIFIY